MKPKTILFFTIFYLTTYLGISYLINYFLNLEVIFLELLVIGLIFSILLIFLLVFDVTERITNKITIRKPEIIVYNDDEEIPESLVAGEEQVVDNFFERNKSVGEGGGKIEENKERVGEFVS